MYIYTHLYIQHVEFSIDYTGLSSWALILTLYIYRLLWGGYN